jgi:hypothetical protein
LFNLLCREPGTLMFKLRQKLQAYFGTDLLQVPDLHTLSPGPSMNNSPDVMDTTHFQSPFNPSRTGSPKRSSTPKPRQSDHTSQASEASTSTSASPPLSSRTSESSESFADPFDYMVPLQLNRAPKSPRTFSFGSFTPSATTTTTSISERHSRQLLPLSFEQENLPGSPGIPRPRLLPHSPVNPSNLSTAASSYIYPCPRPTNSASVTTFHYLPLGTPAAPFVRSEHSSSAIRNHRQPRFSQHPVAHSARNGLRTNSERLSSDLASTPRHTLVTPSAVVQPTLLWQQGSLGRRSKEWAVGSQMQWTDIFPSQQRRPNSFLPTDAFTSQWPPRVRRASLDSLPTLAFDRTDPRNLRTPGLAFQRGCLAADTVLRAFGPVLG